MSAAPPGTARRVAPRRPFRWRDSFRRRLGRKFPRPFDATPGNSIEPIGPGTVFFARMLAAIDAAETSVDLEMYLWHDDDVGRAFASALTRACRRGVRVRVLADAQGAGEAMDIIDAVGASGAADVRVFNPFRFQFWSRYVHRTHRKLLVVDGRVAFTGGAGFSLHFSGAKDGEHPWHDRMYEVRGPVVAQLEAVFASDFDRWDPRCAPCETVGYATPPAPVPGAVGAAEVRVLRGWPDVRDVRPLVLKSIRAATTRVWIGTPYFLPAYSVRKALYAAARRGVEVRVIHPSLEHANAILYHAVRARYGRYIRRGVSIHEYERGFYHAKTLVVDRTLAIVGSSNFDSWSWKRNAEIDLAITDAPTVDAVASLLDADWAGSRLVTREDARIRSFFASVRGRLAASIEGWL